MVDSLADFNSSLCRWVSVGDKVADTYARQALPMLWDFAEINPFGNGSGNSHGQFKTKHISNRELHY